MKTKYFTIVAFITAALFSSCKKEGSPIIAVNNGKWMVAEFSEDGKDIKHLFSGYTLEFEESGQAIARNGDKTVNGSWSCGKDANQLNMNIWFPPEPLFRLHKEWMVTDQCGNNLVKLRYQDASGVDYLTLQKK